MGNIQFNLSQEGHKLKSFTLNKKDVCLQQIDWKILNRISDNDQDDMDYKQTVVSYLDIDGAWVRLKNEADVAAMMVKLKKTINLKVVIKKKETDERFI